MPVSVHVVVVELQSTSHSEAIGDLGPTSRVWEAWAGDMQPVPDPNKQDLPREYGFP